MLEQGGTFHLSCNPVPTLLLIRLFSDCHTSLGNVKNFGNENSWSVTDAHLAFYSFAGLSILRRSSSILTISFDFLASTIMYTYYMKQNHHLMTFFLQRIGPGCRKTEFPVRYLVSRNRLTYTFTAKRGNYLNNATIENDAGQCRSLVFNITKLTFPSNQSFNKVREICPPTVKRRYQNIVLGGFVEVLISLGISIGEAAEKT